MLNRVINFLDSALGYFFLEALITFTTQPGSAFISRLLARSPMLSDLLMVLSPLIGVGFFELLAMSLRFKLVTERDLMSAKFLTAVLINELEIMDEFCA